MDVRLALPGPAADLVPAVPGWAMPHGVIDDPVEAAYLAGAALNSLDILARSEPVWAGAWRQRLALKAAAATARLLRFREDEAALRDAWHLGSSGGEIGPAGSLLLGWRRLATRSPDVDAEALRSLVALFGLAWSESFEALPRLLAAATAESRPAPLVAATLAGEVMALDPRAEALAWAMADLALARRMRWPLSAPILTAQLHAPLLRAGAARRRLKPGDEGFERGLCLAAAAGAVEACRLAADIAGHARRLVALAPKLRAKGAGEAIALIMEEDAVPGTLTTKSLSRWGARRLFDRLVKFDAVRELSGRDSFRLYGL